jgi:hypothetical protein
VIVTRWQHFDGQGAALLEPDGRVRLFVSDELADVVAAAEAEGVSADDVLNKLLDAEIARRPAAPLPVDPHQRFADGTEPVELERLVPRDWSPPDYS